MSLKINGIMLPAARHRGCLQLLAQCDGQDPWDANTARQLAEQLIALIYRLPLPRIPDALSGNAAAKLLCIAL